MKKSVFLIAVFLLLLVFTPSSAFAAKKFVPKSTGSVKRVATGGIPAFVRYRGDRLGILLSFLNFTNLESVSYSFTYTANGMPQGAGGTITAANNPTASRELLFGTCSSGVCTYHNNLSNARLVLTAKRTNGTTVTKRYRIKTYR